jgi:hypothetical protein
VRDLVLCADFIQVRERYSRARLHLLGAAVVGVAAAAAAGVFAAQAERKQTKREQLAAAAPTSIVVRNPTNVRVYLSAGASSAPCPVQDGQAATALGGTYSKPLLLFRAIPASRATPAMPELCRKPWTWVTAAGDVVVVPRPWATGSSGG